MASPTLSQQASSLLEKDLDITGNNNDVTAYNLLMQYINSDPVLINSLNTDIAATDVHSFAWSTQAGSGAFFNGSNDSLNINISPFLQSDPGVSLEYNESFILGHELAHSVFNVANLTGTTPADELKDLDAAVDSGTPDLTTAIQNFEGNYNYNESNSQIAGFNAYLSQYYTDNPGASIQSAYNAFAEYSGYAPSVLQQNSSGNWVLLPGLTTDSSGTGALAVTLANWAAEGNYYYLSNNFGGLSIFEDKNYTNYNGTGAVDDVVNRDLYDGNYTVDGSQDTITSPIQFDFADVSQTNPDSGLATITQSVDPDQLAQDMGSFLSKLPHGATSVTFTAEDTSTGASYIYTVDNGVSSVVSTADGSTPFVYVGMSANPAGTKYQANASDSIVTFAADYDAQIDGSGDTDILGNGSQVTTSAGSEDNNIVCGSSGAVIDGASTDSCSIAAGGVSKLILGDSDLTGSLDGDVVLTGGGDTFSANSNATVTMASGDTVNVGSGVSGVQLTCGSSTETATGGASGSDSVQCTISGGNGEFTNSGADLQVSNAGIGGFWLDGSNDGFVDIATGKVTSGVTNESLFVAGSDDDATMGKDAYLGLTSGTGNIFNVSNDTVVAQSNTGATLNGSSDNITANIGDFSLNGNSNLFNDSGAGTITNGSSNIQLNVAGNGNEATMGNNSYLGLTSGTGDIFNLSDGTVVAQNNTSASLNGSDDNITANIGNFALTGGDNTFTDGATGTITNHTTNISLSVAGSDNAVTMGDNSYLALNSGTGDTFDLSDGTVAAKSDTGADIMGSDDYITAAVGDFTLTGSSNAFTDSTTGTITSGSSNIDVDVAGSSNDVTMGKDSYVALDSGTGDEFNLSNGSVDAQSNTSALIKGSSDTLDTDGGTFQLDGTGFTLDQSASSANTTTDWLDASSSADIDGVEQGTKSTDVESLDYNTSAQETAQTQFSASSGWELNNTNYNPSTGYDENQTVFGNIQDGKDYETQYTDFNTGGDAIQQDNYGTNTFLSDVLTSDGDTKYFTTAYITNGDSADKYFEYVNDYNGSTDALDQSDDYNPASGALDYAAFYDGGKYADKIDFTDGSDPYFGEENTYNTSTGAVESEDLYNGDTGDLEQVNLFEGNDPYPDEEEFTTGTDPYFSTIDVFDPTNGKEEYDDSYNPVTGGFYGRTYYNGYSSGGSDSDGSDSGYGTGGGDGGYGDDGTGYFGGYYGYGGGYNGYDAVKATSGTSKKSGGSNHGRFAAAGQIDQAIASANGVSGANASGGSPVQTDSTTSATLSSAQQAALTAWSKSSLPASSFAPGVAPHAAHAGQAVAEPAAMMPDVVPLSLSGTGPTLTDQPLSPESSVPNLLRAMSSFGANEDPVRPNVASAVPAFQTGPVDAATGEPAAIPSNVVSLALRPGAGSDSATVRLSAAPNLQALIHAMSAFGGERDGVGVEMAFARPMLEDQHLLAMAS